MNIRTKYLLDVGILEIPDPRITHDKIRPSKNFLSKFIYYYLKTNNVDLSIQQAYTRLLRVREVSDADLQIIKDASKNLFKRNGMS